jgi:L-ascorbate metabolism protein UlaG (beta-lactamase superfamily)
MKYIFYLLLTLGILGAGYYFFIHTYTQERAVEVPQQATTTPIVPARTPGDEVSVTPIEHATAVLGWSGMTVYLDPVGGRDAFVGQSAPDIIFLTDIHPDHLDVDTVTALAASSTDVVVVAPHAVAEEFPTAFQSRMVVLANGSTTLQKGFTIEAVPMYNLPKDGVQEYHPQGRGNGYVIEREGTRVYVAGDTEGTPEMRALRDIAIAFIPMNMPYTMTVEDAADAVLAFVPRTVYPYHYRGTGGMSDVARFTSLVEAGNPTIQVMVRDWYPISATSTATTTDEQ